MQALPCFKLDCEKLFGITFSIQQRKQRLSVVVVVSVEEQSELQENLFVYEEV